MKWLILLHVLGATVWVGGHLILSIGFLPKALQQKDPSIVLDFERQYERIGLPALLIQIVTGISMALIYVPLSEWGSLATSHHVYLWTKVGLLAGTVASAIRVRFFILPTLTRETLPTLAFYIVLVTVFALLFMITGLSFRFSYF